MQQMTELLHRLYVSHTGERVPPPQGYASEYETPTSTHGNNISVNGKGSINEYTPASGSTMGVPTQNPVFDVGRWGAMYDLGEDEAIHGDANIDDESGAGYYDVGTVEETDSFAVASDGACQASSGRDDTENGKKNINQADAEVPADAVYDLGSTDTVSIERSRTGAGMTTSPTATRMLNALVAFEEDPEHLTGASILPEANGIYGNEGGETLPGAALRAATTSDIGRQVFVQGYSCGGVLRFVGPHHERGTLRCGVELDEAIGKNDGTVRVSSRKGPAIFISQVTFLSSATFLYVRPYRIHSEAAVTAYFPL
jgi:hypothetical protein